MKKELVLIIIITLMIEIIFPIISLGMNKSNDTNEIENKINDSLAETTDNSIINNSINNNENDNSILSNEISVYNDSKTNTNTSTNNIDNVVNNTNIDNSVEEKNEELELLNSNNSNKTAEEIEFDEFSTSKMQVLYMANVEDEGWQRPVTDGNESGTTGKGKAIYGLKLKLVNAPENAKIKYKIYDNNGWGDIIYDGEQAGDTELNKVIYGVKIELENMEMYSIQYRTHVENYGWLEWVSDGETTGKISSKARIEAIEIRIVSVISKSTNVIYRSYVEDEGWQNTVKNGILSGTTGEGKGIQRIAIELENAKITSKISYQLHVENYGWTDWFCDGEEGRVLEKKWNIEAIKIKLDGLDEYDILYRTHVQDIGWQSWSKNSSISGTEGKGKRIEAIEIKLVKKQSAIEKVGEFSVQYSSHIQNIGWEKDYSKSNGQLSGTTGKGLRIEAIKMRLQNAPTDTKIKYSAYVEGKGWQNDVFDGKTAGSTGNGKKLLGLKVQLVNAENYSIMYRIHVQDIGWKPWVYDGTPTDAIEQVKRIEAIEIKIIPKKEIFAVAYNSHIQNIGWEDDFSKINGDMSGTSGKGLRIEAIKFKLTGNEPGTGIKYRSYIEGQGWQQWKNNGSTSGSMGKGLKLLGLQLELINMPSYSIQYRVHIQDYGWSEWEVDGNTLGKISENKRIEAIQARIINKTVSYPKNVSYTSKISELGWEEEWLHKNGEISGTTGKGLGIYGFKLKLENYGINTGIEYNLHVKNIGWLGWTSNEYLPKADGARLEAIKIRLKNMDEYTVEYRTHVQDIGWQEWMIDGEIAGTTGQGKRVEAIQIRIVPKYYRKLFGVDVSEWNHNIDWQAVKNDGVNFAIIRSGYGQLSSQKDSCFETNYRNAKSVGLKLGSYLYSYAKSIEDARREANNCLGWLGGREFELPIFYDIEDQSQLKLGARTITDMVKVFCSIIHNAGYKTGVYSYYNFLMNNIYFDELPDYCDVWLAHYTGSPNNPTDYPGEYQLWQYSSEGHVDGIDGVVDVNIGYKNY